MLPRNFVNTFAKTTSWMHNVMDISKSIVESFASRRGSVIRTNVGSLINVSHDKFILVLKSIEDMVGYSVINSDRYGKDPESGIKMSDFDQLVIIKKECSALTKGKVLRKLRPCRSCQHG